jgi:P-type Ca2+ transporter type 2C
LTPIDFNEREHVYGSNKKPPPKRVSFFSLFFGALDDFMLKLLLVCACISIAIDVGFAEPEERSHCKYQHYTNNSHLCFFMSPNFGLAWIEGTAIFVAVFVVAFVGSWNDYQKELQFLKLQAISDKDNIVRSHKLTV